MRILFLSHYFPPEVNAPATRTREHCRRWAEAGHDVTVVTCAPNHPRGRVYPGYSNRLWQREYIDGITVIRLWTFLSANEGFLLRTMNYVSFMFACILAAPFLPRSDVLITTSPQFFNGLAGWPVSIIKRCPWVLEIRDLWPESILAVGAIRNRRVIAALEWLERFAYRKAARVVSVTDAFKGHICARGAHPENVYVIKNGVDPDFFQLDDAASPPPELSVGDHFVAAYFGTHGMAHHLETVLEAAELLRDDDRIRFLLVGDGAERAGLLEERDRRGLNNVIMLEQQPKARMPALWQATGASLVLLRNSPLFETVIPSKIFESLAMQRPVILGVRGESRELLERSNAAVFITPEDARELADAVRQLADDPARCRAMGEAGREFVTRHFDRSVLARRYLNMLEAVVTGQPGAAGNVPAAPQQERVDGNNIG